MMGLRGCGGWTPKPLEPLEPLEPPYYYLENQNIYIRRVVGVEESRGSGVPVSLYAPLGE